MSLYYFFRFFRKNVNFRVVWALYLGILSIIGAIIIASIDSLNFLDALFLTVGSITNSGLATVSMTRLSSGTFFIMFLLMMVGGAHFMTTMVMIYKRHRYHLFRSKLAPHSKRFYAEYDEQYEALGVAVQFYILYWLFWNFGLGLLFFGAISVKPFEPELQNRGFSPFLNAMFLSISAFSNSGYTLSSSSLSYLTNNPFAYLLLCCFIAAGNTLSPVLLRFLIQTVRNYRHKQGQDVRHYDYILNKSRRIVTNIFSDAQTNYLAWIFFYLFMLQFIVFLGSSMTNHGVLSELGQSTDKVAGVGLFQAISTRAAGFQMIDMRVLNQGMLAVYALMMYLSSAPFISVMFKSEESTYSIQQTLGEDSSSSSSPSSSSNSQSVPTINEHQRLKKFDKEEEEGEGGEVETEDYGDPEGGEESGKAIGVHSRSKPNRLANTASASGSSINLSQVDPQKHSQIVENGGSAEEDSERAWRFQFGRFNLIKRGASVNRAIFWKHNFFLCLIVVIIAFLEDTKMYSQPTIINLWYVIFEVVSAYGNVGLSFGVPGESYALSGYMSQASQVMIIFVMLMGKHRGLPHSSDAAIDFRFKCLRLPGSRLEDDPEDHQDQLIEERISMHNSVGVRGGNGWLHSDSSKPVISNYFSSSSTSSQDVNPLVSQENVEIEMK